MFGSDSILWIALIGLVAGAVAKFLMPGKDPGGFIITMALGIGGAILSTYLGRAVGWYDAGQGAQFVGAVFGAVLILWGYRVIQKKKA